LGDGDGGDHNVFALVVVPNRNISDDGAEDAPIGEATCLDFADLKELCKTIS
jgi:hypothetical protein